MSISPILAFSIAVILPTPCFDILQNLLNYKFFFQQVVFLFFLSLVFHQVQEWCFFSTDFNNVLFLFIFLTFKFFNFSFFLLWHSIYFPGFSEKYLSYLFFIFLNFSWSFIGSCFLKYQAILQKTFYLSTTIYPYLQHFHQYLLLQHQSDIQVHKHHSQYTHLD